MTLVRDLIKKGGGKFTPTASSNKKVIKKFDDAEAALDKTLKGK